MNHGHLKHVTSSNKEVLTKLGYVDLDFRSIDLASDVILYEGYLDTAYLIRIHVKNPNDLEIWDFIYDEENFVLSGTATRVDGEWQVLEG